MNRNSKKGFTIVELIIVIAVIAVLAAVLIPTFSNLIQKANEAKDTALVSNLNKAVAMDNGSKETVYDVLKVAEDIAGINVAKINAAANSNEILWDSTNKCFVYSVNGEIKYIPDSKTKDVAGDYDYWKLSDKKADVEAGVYSIYWTGAALAEITATTGFDAGEAEIGKIIYQREDNATAQTVTIRTNGGELEVSAKPDTVYHYDVASKVVVTKIHNASYHENGTVVGNLEVKEGHVELGAKADVSTVIVAPTTANAAKVTVTTGATVGVVAATTDEGKTYLDTATTVPSDKKAETKLDESVLSQFAGGIGTEASPYLIGTSSQLKKISSGKYYKLIADVESTIGSNYTHISKSLGSVVIDGNGYTITATGSYWIFEGLYNSILKNINFAIKDVMIGKVVVNSTFENISVDGEISCLDGNWGVFAGYPQGNITFKNCTNNANCSGTSYNAVFCGYIDHTVPNLTLTFENCVNNGTFTSEWASFFVGNNTAKGTKIVANNCKNNAVIRGTSTLDNYNINAVIGHAVNELQMSAQFICNGTTYTGEQLADFAMDGTGYVVKGPEDSSLKLMLNADETFNIIGSSNSKVVYYVVQIGVYARCGDADQFTSKVFATQRIEASEFVENAMNTTLKYLKFVDKTWAANNSTAVKGQLAGNATLTLDGTTYYYIEKDLVDNDVTLQGKVATAQIVTLLAYDKDDVLISSVALTK